MAIVPSQSFLVGERFKGVKMLPPGPHFISCNAAAAHSGAGGDFAPTVGMFVHWEPRQVFVRRWNPQEELLLPLQDPDEVTHRHHRCQVSVALRSLKSLWLNLFTSYPICYDLHVLHNTLHMQHLKFKDSASCTVQPGVVVEGKILLRPLFVCYHPLVQS